MICPVPQPYVPAPAHCACRPGPAPGARFAGSGSLWPGPFPPSPPRPIGRRCSETSPVLRACPTAPARSSSACVRRLPDAARCTIRSGQTRALPVLARGVSVHARGLRPRGTSQHLAVATLEMWPSASDHGVGVPEFGPFRGSIPDLHVPLSTLRTDPCGPSRMTRGRCGSLRLHRATLAFAAPRRFIPAHGDPFPPRDPTKQPDRVGMARR